MLAPRLRHYNLGVVTTLDMLGCRDRLRGKGFGMMQNLVGNFVLVQKIDEFFRYLHKLPPLQFRGLAYPRPFCQMLTVYCTQSSSRDSLGHQIRGRKWLPSRGLECF